MSPGNRHSTRRATTAGFTLVELFISVAILSVLMGLILPAVQSARESARRMQCRDRLRQLTLAVHLFHDSRDALPPLEIADSWATWAVFLLPHADQKSLYDQWQLDRRYYAQAADSGKDLPIFHCPSRPAVANPAVGTSGSFLGRAVVGPPGWSDFGACAGTSIRRENGAFATAIDVTTGVTSAQPGSGRNELLELKHPGWCLPLKWRDHSLDGLSFTILLGEMHLPNGRKLDSVFNGDNPSASSRLLGHDGPWNSVEQRYPAEFGLVDQPSFAGTNWSNRFGSAHIGVCHFSLADGSVRSWNVSTNLEVLDRLARRGDGHPVFPD